MKILIISYSDISGGAAKAAFRLHTAFLQQKINSNMLVIKKKSNDIRVLDPKTKIEKFISFFLPFIEKFKAEIFYRQKKGMFSPGTTGFPGIINKINSMKPDIVHLHWINGGMIKIEDLKKINAPIVWSLQDMWPLTGGCHFCNCNLYHRECSSCSANIYFKKEKNYEKINRLIINGTSKWIAECAKKSSLFKDRKIVHLPNIIDTNSFKPIDKKKVRKLFDIPQNKKIILFAASDIDDPRKGLKKLLLALSELNYSNLIFVIAGKKKPKKPIETKFPVYYIPPVNDDFSLSSVYNIANTVILPSTQDNLSNIVIESMSCGIPVVAFDIGGNSDMIEHKVNGYLAKPFETEDLANGIKYIMNSSEYGELCNNAREKAKKKFDSTVVARQYEQLYNEIL